MNDLIWMERKLVKSVSLKPEFAMLDFVLAHVEGIPEVTRPLKFTKLPYFFAYKNGTHVDSVKNYGSPLAERFFSKFTTNRWFSHRLVQLDENDLGLKKLYEQQGKQKGRTIIVGFMEMHKYVNI